MGIIFDLPPLSDHNAWSDVWYYDFGINVIPANTRLKTTSTEWKQWQQKSIPEELHEKWKKENKFDDGMAIIVGKVWRGDHKGEYLIFVDLDNLKAIEEFCTRNGETVSLEQIAEKFIVEQHKDDTNKAHIFFYSKIAFPKKSTDIHVPGLSDKIQRGEIPAFEIKGMGTHGIAFCTPSMHKNGERYRIIGTSEPTLLDEKTAYEMMQRINSICEAYGLTYLSGNGGSGGDGNGKSTHGHGLPVKELFKEGTVILEGHNRHNALLKMTMSLVANLRGKVPLSTIKEMAFSVANTKHCKPPIDREEFEGNIWRSVIRYIPANQRYEDDARENITKATEAEAAKETLDTSSTTTPPVPLSVSQALLAEEGYHAIRGSISTMWLPYDIVTAEQFQCIQCNNLTVEQYEYPLPYVKWGLTGSRISYPNCKKCRDNSWQRFVRVFTQPAMNVELLDTDVFEDIKRIGVILTREQINQVKAGERLIIRGDLRVLQNKSRKGAGKYYHVLYANIVESEDREETELTSKDVKDIERFCKICKERFGGESGIIDRLVWMHSPEVIGCNFVKHGLLFLEVSTGTDTALSSKGAAKYMMRNRINAGLFGPPGRGKSMLLRASVRHVNNSRYESGQNSSGLSLTAMVQKDDDSYMMRTGPAAHARGAICAINEAGWLKFTDQSQLLDVMEEGFFTVNKHGFNARIRAETSIILSANPKFHAQFSESSSSADNAVNMDELPLLKQVIDRLDLIMIFKQEADEQAIRDFVDKKSEQEDRTIRNYDVFLRKLVLYCRSLNPKVDQEARSILNEAYIRIVFKVQQNKLPFGSHRIRDTLFRITRTIAKLKLKKIADKNDAKEALEFYNSMVQQTIGVIAIPESPRDLAVNIMLDTLKKDAIVNDLSLKELADRACLVNPQVASYLHGNHSDTGANNRLREIREILLNHGSVTKGQRDKPLTLR